MQGIAVTGAGHWGKNLVRNFAAIPSVELKYVCDLNDSIRSTMASLYPDATVTDDFAAALADESVTAVVVAVDAPLHHKLAKQALEAGKHVYVEKPLTLSSADAKDLVSTAEAKGVKLMVGHLLEYHPAVNYLKDRIGDGTVGDPLYLYFQRVNLGIVREAENAWWSLAPHDISVACYLFDAEPVSVTASGHDYLRNGVEDVVFATLKFADGKMAHIHVSWLDPHKIRRMTLVGTQKMMVFDDMEAAEKVRVYDKGAEIKSVDNYVEAVTLRTGDILIPKIAGGEPLRTECEHFIDCIENDTTPRSDGQDGLRVVKVLEAGGESLRQGGVLIDLKNGGGND
ncbi:MAG: Gfo/Idh/MocA family oxidoreductase [Planctomycetes bacterium]|nr:Gfo/Idh/MocA family oxidoreductase [Planctomycetota bacterium]